MLTYQGIMLTCLMSKIPHVTTPNFYFMIMVDLWLDSNSVANGIRLCEGWLDEVFGPFEHSAQSPSVQLPISLTMSHGCLLQSRKALKPTIHRGHLDGREGPHLNPSRWCVVVPITKRLNTTDVLQRSPSLPIKKGHHLNPWGGLLWFQ